MKTLTALVDCYLQQSGFLTCSRASETESTGLGLRSLVIGVRLPMPTIGVGTASTRIVRPDSAIVSWPDAIEAILGVVDPWGETVDLGIPTDAVEDLIIRAGICEGNPSTMALTLVRSGMAHSYLMDRRLRVRLIVFGTLDPSLHRYEIIEMSHVATASGQSHDRESERRHSFSWEWKSNLLPARFDAAIEGERK